MGQRHASYRFVAVAGGIVNQKTVDKHRFVLGRASDFAWSILLTQG
jgi:hypothetical protein